MFKLSMSRLSGMIVALGLGGFVLAAQAFQVSVRSASPAVSALGFTVNGKNHGAAGKSYSASNMQPGMYSFGVRVNGVLMGQDVGCSYRGKELVKLQRDTTAVLDYNGSRCTLQLF